MHQHQLIASGYFNGPRNGKTVNGYWTLSDRVLLLKIARKPLDLNIIQMYAPTSTISDEDIDKFY